MVEALWYRPSDWLEGLRLLWGRFRRQGGGWREGFISELRTRQRPHTPVRAQSVIGFGWRPALHGIGDEFGGSYGLAHFSCDQLEKGQIPTLVVVCSVLGSSQLFFLGQDL